eukprot:CAMPEP_0172430060 /NCGR_PEP_ID=MMETSP1064-20121228/52917_1 /TAXON_ID=202472 /ORGANISM="Aulacoseira subarctica , Strain CCAP 1002/5" /LENGTH=427 /DNA_ID=CAMNT_0013175851 /DNA_START=94 /DNA_END=1377 /DNA_ORIENTATION=+
MERINARNSSTIALRIPDNNGQGANETDGSSVASTIALQASDKNGQGANEVDGSSTAENNISKDNHSNSSAQLAEDDSAKKSSRRFLNYTSSQWELMWLENIQEWEKNRTICENVLSSEQEPFLHKFQETICTHHIEDSSWCAVQDPYEGTSYLYNKVKRTFAGPGSVPHLNWEHIKTIDPQPVVPQEDNGDGGIPKVFSRLDFIDDITGEVYSEYIEPLVSHLRHPVAGCADVSVLSRSYIVPVPPARASSFPKAYYFDAGASQWNDGGGGPSLSYFTAVWKRHGLDFYHIEAWEGTGSKEAFYATVPEEYKYRTFYHEAFIASSPNTTDPFVPFVIKKTTQKEDYVLFKLDIDNGPVEKGTVDYLLSSADDSLEYITEFVWEHHVRGNYIMAGWWGDSVDELSIFDSYMYFLQLRQRGVRAHSYV